MLTRNEPSLPVTIHYPGYRACTVCDFQFYPSGDETVCGLCLTAQAMNGQPMLKNEPDPIPAEPKPAPDERKRAYSREWERQKREKLRLLRTEVKECAYCYQTFTTASSVKITCSPACQKNRKLQLRREMREAEKRRSRAA